MTEGILSSLKELEKLADRIKESQRFGQSLLSTATVDWAATLTYHIHNIRNGLNADGHSSVRPRSIS